MTAWRQGYATRLQLMVSPVVATSVLPGVLKAYMGADVRIGEWERKGAAVERTLTLGPGYLLTDPPFVYQRSGVVNLRHLPLDEGTVIKLPLDENPPRE